MAFKKGSKRGERKLKNTNKTNGTFNKGTIAALLVLAVGTAFWIWQARANTALDLTASLLQQRQSVANNVMPLRLSNGQSIWVGESKQELLLTVRGSLRQASPGLYQYPGDLLKPVEVSINVESDKVVGLFVSKNPLNRVLLGDAGIGISSTELMSKLRVQGLALIDTQSDKVKQRGYKLVRGNVSTYFLLPACGGENVVSVVMALDGYDSVLTPFSTLHDCAGQQLGAVE
jgi:hypothetical protein